MVPNKNLFISNMCHMVNDEDYSWVSDGYHTFRELYRHRAILTAALCNAHPEMCWKSKLHADGTMYDNYFIVGVDTPYGQATYHYPLEYWNLFHVTELSNAPEWDGHTPENAICRIAMAFCGAPAAQRKEESI